MTPKLTMMLPRHAMPLALGALVALVALGACALTRNAPPLDIRYFTPEAPAAPPSMTAASPTSGPDPVPVRLRLGRIDRADVLDHRIVRRTSAVELALYDTRRWTETPDEYVRRALLDALFETGRLARALSGTDPTLDVELLAFEEVMTPRHVGRVRLRYVLHDRRTVLAAGQLVAEAAVRGDDFEAVVRALAAANQDAAAQLADRVRRRLCPTPPPQ